MVLHHLVSEQGLAWLALCLLIWVLAIEWGVFDVGWTKVQCPMSADY